MAVDTKVRGFILAAGFGTRLAPVTDHVCKPLLPLKGATLLDHAISAFDKAEISDIAVNGHHLGHQIVEHIAARKDSSRFEVFNEEEILGTGGGLYGAREFLSKSDLFVVFNGDVLCDVNLADLLDAHKQHGGLATLLLVDHPDVNTVHLGPHQEIVHIEGAGPLSDNRIPDECRALTYCGIGVFSSQLLERMEPGFSSLITPLVEALKVNPHSVHGYAPDNLRWDDLGTLTRFLSVTQEAEQKPENFAWLEAANKGPLQVERITGHGSDRCFWRIKAVAWSAVAMRSHPEDEEFERQLAITSFLRNHGLGAAEILSEDTIGKTLLMEDLGSESLFALAQHSPPEKVTMLYHQVVDHLLRLQAFTETAKKECPLAVDRCLDRDTLLWETRYFQEHFLVGYCGIQPELLTGLSSVFTALANMVSNQPLVLLHRDFQSQNIHFKKSRVRLVDVQGMRLGPLGYDIMSLVMDPYVGLSENVRLSLLGQFSIGCSVSEKEARTMALTAGLQRLMQALGAYGFLGIVRGKKHFLGHIPAALTNLNSVLEELAKQNGAGPGSLGAGFVELKRVLEPINDNLPGVENSST